MQVAKLLFDSGRARALPGLRALVSDERSLLYRAAGLTVDLVVFPAPGGLRLLHGQVIDHVAECSVPHARVLLEGSPEPTQTDAFGQFSLSSIEPVAGRSVHVEAVGVRFACTIPSEHPQGGGR